MRSGVITALGLVAATARAEPRLEASGFVGIGYFGDQTELGNSWAPEQVPGTAPVLGARLSYLVSPALTDRQGPLPLQLALEGELAIAAAFTGGSFLGDGGRMSYFAPVFGWRAQAAVRVARWPTATPFVVIGGGGATVASSSPFMSKETDPVVYYGPGLTIPVGGRWRVRFDLRHGIMPARDTGMTSTVELQLGVSTTFGLPQKTVRPARPSGQPAVDESDGDGDGLADRLDRCPSQRETINGLDDADGCPEVDADGDGVIGAADNCPAVAEDFDRFSDDDGCPDPDNDADGIEDARDACPGEPETPNGIDDDNGCPDGVPTEVTQTLAAASSVNFETTRARVTDAAKQALGPLLALLRERPDIRIGIVGHPDKAGSADLAKRRAEAVKWYVVDQGVAEDRIETSVGVTRALPIDVTLLVHK